MKQVDELLEMLNEESWKMVGSAPSIEVLTELIKKKWYWDKVEAKEVSNGIYDVINSKGKAEGVRIVKKGGRYRFEMKLG